MNCRSRFALCAVVVAGFVIPLQASAHLASSGMGPVYDGLLHFLLSPEDIVAVIALGLLAGLLGPDFGRRVLLALPLSWFLGCLIGTWTLPALAWPVAAISFMVLGGLVALDAKLSLRLTTTLAVALGLAHGALNGGGMRWSASVLAAYAGLAATVAVVVALVSAFVVRLERQWARIVVRVAGSWIAASGLLLLGWALRRG